MKKYILLTLSLLVAACGGGSGGSGSGITSVDNTGIPTTNPNDNVNPQITNDHISTNMVTSASNESEVRSAIIAYVGERLGNDIYNSATPSNAPRRNNNRAATTLASSAANFDTQYNIAKAKLENMQETLGEMIDKTPEQLQEYISEHQDSVREALKLYVDNIDTIDWEDMDVVLDVYNNQSITTESLETFDENHDFKIIRENIEDIDFTLHGDAIYDYRNMHFIVENGKVKQITLKESVTSSSPYLTPEAQAMIKAHMPDRVLKHKKDNSFDITQYIYSPILTGQEGSQWYDLTQGETIDETKWIFTSNRQLSLEEIKQNLKDKLSEFCPTCTEEKIAQFNTKIDSLTENEVRGGHGKNVDDLAIGEKGLAGEMNLTMMGNDIGLQYSDFGYINGNLTITDAINGTENNSQYGVFAGGYNSKEIKAKPDEGSVFVGSAVADITKETQTRTYKDENNFDVDISKSYMLTQTNDAKLEFKDGKETLTMNFSKSTENPWYDMVVTSNSVNFSGDDSKVSEEFRLTEEMKTVQTNSENDYRIQDFTPRYFGNNGTPTEVISSSTVMTDNSESFSNHETELQYVRFTIDSAFGGKLEQ